MTILDRFDLAPRFATTRDGAPALSEQQMEGGGLPTSSQGHCGALTPQSGGAPSPLFWSVPPCSFRQPRNGAVLRCAAPPSG